MSTDPREERLKRRIAELSATDIQFADARPSEAVSEAIEQPGLHLPQLVHPTFVTRRQLTVRNTDIPTASSCSAILRSRSDVSRVAKPSR